MMVQRQLIIDIFGTINFTGSHRILLGNSSVIYVYGNITKVGGVNDFIQIGAIHIWDQTDGNVIGPKYATSATGSFVPFVPLPVKFISFTVIYTNHSALIQWSTAEELNAKDFTIEKSIDGLNWIDYAVIKAVGNTNNESDYSYSDKNINSSVQYYRIKETDFTGQITYTSIKSIKTNDASTLNIIISSMGSNKVLIQFSSEIKGQVQIQYISLAGQVLTKQILNNPLGQQIISNSSLHGNYFISVITEQGQHLTKQVIL